MPKVRSQWFKALLALPALLLVPLSSSISATERSEISDPNKTLSPYFQVVSDQTETDTLPLKSTRADVNISGVIAQVKVTQVYKNEGKNTLEAIYIFPASTRAAVYAMKMTIGERVIEAKINEREKARKEYEAAVAAGKTASLLEQQRPNVFQMNVGNILPGDVIKVEMTYTELLLPENNIYSFVYPTVVGPRYSNKPAEGAKDTDKWVANPYLHSGKDAPFTFGIDVTLNSGLPIAQISCPSHSDSKVEYTGKQVATVTIPESTTAGNRDVVIKYSLAGDQIESGLLLYPGKDENFFLMLMEPPKRVTPKAIVPREYIFILDVSGSMEGFPLDTTKVLMRDLLGHLRPSDYFNLLLFAGGNAVLSERSLPATPENLKRALDTIDHEQGGGGTELVPALKRALALPRAENTSRCMVIATDGYVDVEKDAFELIRQNLGKANLFAFGIGSSVNRFLIEGMAHAGMGEPFVVLDQSQAAEQAKQLREYIEAPVLTQVQVKFEGLQAYDVEPLAVPDLFARKPVLVFGKYRGEPQGRIVVQGQAAGEKYEQVLELKQAVRSEKNEALRYLWARQRIMLLDDMNKLESSDARIKQVTELGLKYNLMTQYTSFVAVDSVVRADGSKTVKVKQPLPLPQGVSDHAVGGVSPSTSMGFAQKSMARGAYSMAVKDEMEVSENQLAVQPKPVPAPQINWKVTGIQGGLDRGAVEKVLKAGQTQFEQVIAGQTGVNGELELELEIDAQGQVLQVKTLRDKLNQSDLVSQVVQVLKGLTFGATSDGKPVKVKVKFEFKG